MSESKNADLASLAHSLEGVILVDTYGNRWTFRRYAKNQFYLVCAEYAEEGPKVKAAHILPDSLVFDIDNASTLTIKKKEVVRTYNIWEQV